jgi:hypothetical protein
MAIPGSILGSGTPAKVLESSGGLVGGEGFEPPTPSV